MVWYQNAFHWANLTNKQTMSPLHTLFSTKTFPSYTANQTQSVLINEHESWTHKSRTYRAKHQTRYLNTILICVKSGACTAASRGALKPTWLSCVSGYAHGNCAAELQLASFLCPERSFTPLCSFISAGSVTTARPAESKKPPFHLRYTVNSLLT